MDMFKEYEGNFRINWINDTRALFIFNTEENARSALLSKQNETKYKVYIFIFNNYNIYDK